VRDRTYLAIGLVVFGALAAAVLAALAVTAATARAAVPGRTPAGGVVAAVASHASVGRAPELLSQTGLYCLDGSVDPRNRPFAPQYPLWTDGAAKSRWVRLPEGSKIDVSDVDAWRFPPGTTFWKEFSWEGRKVETRMVRVGAGGEVMFASYVWKEDQSDAVLAPEGGVPGVYGVAEGKRHSIPSVADCISCHQSSPSVALGFTALQLSDDRDPMAPHAVPVPEGGVTLRGLVEEGRLSPPRPELAVRPPRIRASDPVARAAMGYLSANCGHCHNTRGPLARLGFSFLHASGDSSSPEPVLVTAVASHGRYVVPGVPADSSYLIAPGAPNRSAVLYRMSSRRPSSQMPPVGTVLRNEEATKLVREWIEHLRPTTASTALAPGRGN
jgi:hypothetical protein